MSKRTIFCLVLLQAFACSDPPTQSIPDLGEPDFGEPDATDNADADAGAEPDSNQRQSTFTIDLRADTNRDGTVSFDDATEDANEDEWSTTHGAIFLANIDDDLDACPSNVTDDRLASCFDGNDDVVNGLTDLLDMATVELRATDVPIDAIATLEIDNASRVRLFTATGDDFSIVDETTEFTAEQLSAGITLHLEGRDVVRDTSWNGFTSIVVTATSGESDDVVTDAVQLRVAPLLLAHHLLPPGTAYVSERPAGGDGAFTRDLDAAVNEANFGNELAEIRVEDQWAQDYFEVGYMTMPTVDGVHTIDVYIRSANLQRNGLRSAGRFAYAVHGPDVAGLTQYEPNRTTSDPYLDSLNSFGNTETIPPYDGYPVGRILRGKRNGEAADEKMFGMFEAQNVQNPLYIDTGWLLVGHVDETVSFLKDQRDGGWSMAFNDAALARQMLLEAQTNGFGATQMHTERFWVDFQNFREVSAAVTIDELLNNANVMAASAEAVLEIAEQVERIVGETGMDETRLLPIPFLHESQGGASVAYQPGAVNGISLGDTFFAAPEMHGPVVDGVDIFAVAVESVISPLGITVQWIEDWNMYHRFSGEVHCGTNMRRIPVDNWWNSERGVTQ